MTLSILHTLPAWVSIWLYIFGKAVLNYNQGLLAFFMFAIGAVGASILVLYKDSFRKKQD
jgi:hypothetical protein